MNYQYHKLISCLIFFGLAFSFLGSTPIYAALSNCDIDTIAVPNPDVPQMNDATICAQAQTEQDILNIRNIKVYCINTSAPVDGITPRTECTTNILDPNSHPMQEKNIVTDSSWVGQDSSGKYFTCFTVQAINRDVGVIQVTINDANGNSMCSTPNINVAPADYKWGERISRAVETALPGGEDFNTGDVNSLTCANGGINTALGCITTKNLAGSVTSVMGIIIGMSGGIALLLMGFGLYIISSSNGIPDKIKEGQSIMTSAVFGLIFIVLSIVFFRLIGVNILSIPGLK